MANDLFRIRIGGASNVGWVEIAAADDSAGNLCKDTI
jgi:hypothetical protein